MICIIPTKTTIPEIATPAKINCPIFVIKEFLAYPESSGSSSMLLRVCVHFAIKSRRYLTHSFGMIFREETETIVLRHISRLLGSPKLSIGICVIIYNVLSRLHMRFIEAPKTTAIKTFATTPEVRDESTKEKAFFIARIIAK